ncbi:sensor histidine kinase [Bacteroides helcogenes]|uniref:Signal transduction histidine kinase, LytS n=1 Tax=Bacteroides helcogenes (strain ATCC 35417 / DSM 20613 / JCM 6297 / CCUG 15421 / P 36-108) TaxID=693979 RepID=E6STW3_BACT6|nr:histidine kinase [Bacteroides helcogenes]ADV42316.1 signal transduction histidine kinase, LytS [Bacteroides helcogenes P 36-108]MDY5237228.1 histidine kinase [Bacteroides helcogenes]
MTPTSTPQHPGEHTVPSLFTSPRLRIYRHLILQSVILIMTLNIALDREAKLCGQSGNTIAWASYYLLVNCGIYFNLYVLAPRYLEKERYKRYLAGIACTTAFILAGVFALQANVLDSQSPETILSPGLVSLNLLSSTLAIGLMLAGTSTFLLLRHWAGYNQRISELESNTLQSELKQLKRQINPHFLFNMLNNANVLLKKNPEEASQLLFKLEDMLRYQLNSSSEDEVALSSDIRFLNDFLNLEKVRRDHFEYTLSKEGDIDRIYLPPLLFIPFVENAVKHNPDNENTSYVHLSFKMWKQQLTFQCTNSKPKKKAETSTAKAGGLGLKNIKRRLELLYPDRYSLEIDETEDEYKVNLQLTL